MRCVFLGNNRPASMAPKDKTIVVRKPQQSLPVEQWPFWAKKIAGFRREGDAGLGDTVTHLIGDERSARFKTWFAGTFGRSCGCTERREWLNARFPYPATALIN